MSELGGFGIRKDGSGGGGSSSVATFFVNLATTAPLDTNVYDNGASGVGATLTAFANGTISNIDGSGVTLGTNILVKNEVNGWKNGVYNVTSIGSGSSKWVLTRLSTYDTTAEVYPSQVNVIFGSTNANKIFFQNTVNPVIGTDVLSYSTSSLTSPVPIANGGTNATSYTAPSGTICPIIYYTGTKFEGDSNVLHLGYDTATDTFYSGKITISSSGTQTAKFTNTATQSTTAGAGMEGFSDDGTAMVSGNRLGFYTLGGATNTSHTTVNSIAIEGFATENWNGTSAGSKLTFSTTANGGTTRGVALELGQDKTVKISNAYTLPTTAPTSGQVLGYVSAGVSGWVTPTVSSGVFGIANTSGVYTYYTTLTLAMASAVSGDTIEQFGNVTESGAVTITWKSGVNFNGNAYTYKHTATSANIINLATGCKFYNWNIEKTASTSTGNGFYGSGSSDINFYGVTLKTTITSGGYISVWLQSGARLNGLNVICSGTSSGIYLDGSGEIASNCNVDATASTGYGFYGAGATINRCYAISNSGGAITGSSVFQVNNCVGISTSSTGISGGEVRNSIGVSTTSTGIFCTNAYNSTAISTSGVPNNVGTAYNCIFKSSSNIATLSTTAHNCSFYSATNNIIFDYALVAYNCTFETAWNNASGHCIAPYTTCNLYNCMLKVANASAYCLTSAYAGTYNYKYTGCVFIGATTPVNTSKVVQTITNTQDNQGNILV